jgi:uncharacterized Fe-S cluster protein YjdI
MNRKITKHYSNGEVTVVWKNDLCAHSGNCVRGLPEVFNRSNSPWVNIKGATTSQIIEQIRKCPSGALSFFMNDQSEDQSKKSS